MDEHHQAERFREVALPHLHAAYRLARWLTRDHEIAQEVVQEAYESAYRSFAAYRGGDGRCWILAIVRNESYEWLRRNRREASHEVFDEETYLGGEGDVGPALRRNDPEALLVLRDDSQRLTRALERLPAAYREIIVLREFDALSYREIADLAGIPLGTVMSRLARARGALLADLRDRGG
ncbi:MAG TPA: sigma-70 family RNA polymerase sigma factor [Aromatoleum sp.]|uniref:sigma-70 family RNA polymerase sigma factor n=1 Tax=Aromatoleum sp. TaxID=2307007 RepID=UPI002B490014|nr:sigma-70 family RNA polymerase sigma factor [Aromatoleum sp.]HJV26013.1 sigma-70 family RNA polymerase sigma factor [Aromatoleum sp.]